MNVDCDPPQAPDGDRRPLVALTMGDPAGIGPELCLAVLADPSLCATCVPVVFGDAGVLQRVAERCERPPFAADVCGLDRWRAAPRASAPRVVDCACIDPDAVEPGTVNAACGAAACAYVRTAVEMALRGDVDAVVTAPLHKEALRAAGVTHAGHTELIADLTGAARVCMMLASERLVVSFVTTHVGLVDVGAGVTEARVLEVIELTAEAMSRLKGGAARLGVCGLNPHGGEHGLFGRGEEQRLIEPAIATARRRGIDVEGPLVADTAFVPGHRDRFDALVCMYHDQGHIPFKMLAFDTGINITLGLPIVRVSVDHGTAFDIAWRGIARAGSLRRAVASATALAIGRPVFP